MCEMIMNSEEFEKWENANHIPENIMAIVNAIAEKLGIGVYEETIAITNVYGEVCSYARGFRFAQLVYSFEDADPDEWRDKAGALMQWLNKDLFEIVNVHDNYEGENQWTAYKFCDIIYRNSESHDNFMRYARTAEEEGFADETERMEFQMDFEDMY